MLNDRVHKFASKRATAWSKTQLPGYWTVLQVLACAGFAIFILVQLLGGPSSDTEAGAGVPGFETQQGSPVPEVPADSPSTPAATGDAPDAAPAAPAGSATSVVDVSGKPVDVPEQAATTAAAGLRAMFDPATAATVPVVGGGTMRAPAREFPAATIGSLVYVTQDGPEHLVFAATTDADGDGPVFSSITTTITVVQQDGQWLVEVI